MFRSEPLNSSSKPDKPSRLLPRLCWVISGAALLASLAWIAFGKDKGLGILLGVMAIVVNRILLGDIARNHEQNAVEADHSRSEPRD